MSDGWPALAVGAAFLTALVAENVRTQRLRDVISLSGLAAALAAALVMAVITGDASPLVGSAAGAGGLFAICFVVEFARPTTIGFGTVKSSALLGAASGGLGAAAWLGSVGGLAIASIAIGVAALRTSRRKLPSGPALAVGLISAVVVALATG